MLTEVRFVSDIGIFVDIDNFDDTGMFLDGTCKILQSEFCLNVRKMFYLSFQKISLNSSFDLQ